MDLSATKMLNIHLGSFTSHLHSFTSHLQYVALAVQVVAVMGLGLLHQGSGHHDMSEVLLRKIGRLLSPETKHYIDKKSYSLSAGIALGLVTLGVRICNPLRENKSQKSNV